MKANKQCGAFNIMKVYINEDWVLSEKVRN